ncbi:PREDICTED: uncharacterized protein LOC106785856 [Polistes canadensis]|uniref:uncharacterized protein LOC106785856 n=1 Tax=Polistes canadensis TaxID=91411 RepID=UPI000718C63A|nr:PREDICTED: uncharacterized protein LOC106785856 [Polistes canadensis]
MATVSSTLVINTADQNISNSTASNSVIDNTNYESQVTPFLQCFVCDVIVKGRYYSLATCKTQSSKSKVIEKLGEMVGERYMVVISEDDVICRSCANLINTLDRLETEMCSIRENVLRFLEQKYSLKEGELLDNSEKPKLSQPPQITRSNTRNSCNRFKRKDDTLCVNTMEYNKGKKNVWMQCDKCKYTTHHNSFMIHHIRDYIKQQRIFCDKCGIQFSGDHQAINHECDVNKHQNEMEIIKDHEREKGVSIKDNNEDLTKMSDIEKSVHQSMPMLPFHTYSQLQITNENIPVIRLANSESLHIPNILEHDETSISDQPMYVRILQHINVNDNFMHPTELASTHNDVDMMVKVKDNSTKQLLTLTEDGNLEMVEVTCWNDMQPIDPDPDTDMHF